ncbi:MAG TPA: nicotinate-nicotinamide nucleotide adenylyltransferase [Polyangiaceae bacterium]
MTVTTNVAVFGGSFNPPHVAHVLAVAYVLSTTEVDRVVVVPAFKHPFGKPLAPFDDRVRMTELALEPIPNASVSRVEETLDGLTLHTLEALKKAHSEWSLRLVMGADILLETSKWFRFDEVRRLAPPIVLGRAGITTEGAPPHVLPEISSTRVRDLVAAKAWNDLAPLVPRKVIEHIRARGLYA